MTLYDILEVSPAASPDVIEAAWKSLSKRYHPDNQKTGNAERIKAINGSHDVLSDPKQRKAYDAKLSGERSRQASAPGQGRNAAQPTMPVPPPHMPTIEAVLQYHAQQIISGVVSQAMHFNPFVREVVKQAAGPRRRRS